MDDLEQISRRIAHERAQVGFHRHSQGLRDGVVLACEASRAEGNSVAHVAARLGVPVPTLYWWLKHRNAFVAVRPAETQPETRRLEPDRQDPSGVTLFDYASSVRISCRTPAEAVAIVRGLR